jgi:Polyketide cyclase / dehydrase and lipid transport
MMRSWRNWRVWLLMALSWAAVSAHAAQVLGVQVTRADHRFLIDMQIRIAAPPQAVFRALQDYPAMPRYNPDLRAVRVEPTAVPGRVRLFTTVRACVLVFCRTMHQEEVMTATSDVRGGVLEAKLLAHSGDFKGGRGRWTVRACPAAPGASCLDVRIALRPAFWVPPVIGPWILRRKMEEEARRTSAGLESVARSRDRR